jgi:hypothetical protein
MRILGSSITSNQSHLTPAYPSTTIQASGKRNGNSPGSYPGGSWFDSSPRYCEPRWGCDEPVDRRGAALRFVGRNQRYARPKASGYDSLPGGCWYRNTPPGAGRCRAASFPALIYTHPSPMIQTTSRTPVVGLEFTALGSHGGTSPRKSPSLRSNEPRELASQAIWGSESRRASHSGGFSIGRAHLDPPAPAPDNPLSLREVASSDRPDPGRDAGAGAIGVDRVCYTHPIGPSHGPLTWVPFQMVPSR